jgi:oxaloacetate decarboxylase alpha subunit
VTISYTSIPVHTLEAYVEMIKRIESMGATSICIKDMAGILGPQECYDFVKAIKSVSKLRLHLHTHCTTGLAPLTYLKGMEAGADCIDTAISCFSGGTSQPPTETLVYAMEQLGYAHDVKMDVLKEINDFFKPVVAGYIKDGTLDPKVMGTETDALTFQVPGGMLSNMISQLKTMNAMEKFPEVLAEVPRVRKDMGYPPLVTPTSQIVGVQAATNVLVGERYKNVSKEVAAYLRGEYGTPPGEVSQDLIKKVLGDEKPHTGRYADTLAPGFEAGRKAAGSLVRSDEDVCSYIVFPDVFEKFAKQREEKERNRVKYTLTREK